jgi:hypothetical protein
VRKISKTWKNLVYNNLYAIKVKGIIKESLIEIKDKLQPVAHITVADEFILSESSKSDII